MMMKLTRASAYRPHMVGDYLCQWFAGLLAGTNGEARISRLGVCDTNIVIRANGLLIASCRLSSAAAMTSLLKHRDVEWGAKSRTPSPDHVCH
jgi:hypothetical protein